jgi:CHAT domain-containing protein
MSEPNLITSLPDAATPADSDYAADGYLSSSEISALHLNADLVVLSACNTGGAGKSGGESLSGLTRAFFFAGARALLVSHWYVDDAATYQLMARMFEELRRDPSPSLSDALRAAQVWMIDESPEHTRWAAPHYWAAFTIVGDGARGLAGI